MFSTSESGTLSKWVFYTQSGYSGSGNVYWELQDTSGGLPGASIGGVQMKNINTILAGWNELTWSTPPSISSGQSYAVVIWADASGTFTYNYINPGPFQNGYQSNDAGSSYTPINGPGDFAYQLYLGQESGESA